MITITATLSPRHLAGTSNTISIPHYPGARILEIDKENGTTEIEIIDGNVCRELLFDRTDNWIQTKTETAYRDIPAIIQQAIANSIYASYRIDDIYHIETSTAEYFYIEFESTAVKKKSESICKEISSKLSITLSRSCTD